MRRLRGKYGDIPLSEFKTLVRDQYFMLLIDKDASLAAIPSMLPSEAGTRSQAFDIIKEVMAAVGKLSPEDDTRLRDIGRLFGIGQEGAAIPFPQNRRSLQAKPL